MWGVLFLFLALLLGFTLRGRLLFGFFHGLAGLFGLLGTALGLLLALGADDLLRAQQLDEGLLAAIALPPARAHDAQVAALAVAEARRDGVKQLLHRFAGHQVGRRLAARRQVAALAQGDHALHVRAHGLGLGHRGLDAFLQDERGHQVAQQRAPVTGVAAEFRTCDSMSHGSIWLLA